MKQRTMLLITLISSILATSYANANLVIDGGQMTVTAGGHNGGINYDSGLPVVVPPAPAVTESLTLEANAVGEFFVEAINSGDYVDTYASNLLRVDSNSFVFDGITNGSFGGAIGYDVLYGSSRGEINFTLHQTGVFDYSVLEVSTVLTISGMTQGDVYTCDYSCTGLNDVQLISDSYTIQYYFSSTYAAGTPFDNALSFSVAAPVPVPAAVWFFGSGLLGLIGIARRKRV